MNVGIRSVICMGRDNSILHVIHGRNEWITRGRGRRKSRIMTILDRENHVDKVLF